MLWSHCALKKSTSMLLSYLGAQNDCSNMLRSHSGAQKDCSSMLRSHSGAPKDCSSMLRSHLGTQNHCSSMLRSCLGAQNDCSSLLRRHCVLEVTAPASFGATLCSKALLEPRFDDFMRSKLPFEFTGLGHTDLCSTTLCSALLRAWNARVHTSMYIYIIYICIYIYRKSL